MLAAWVLGSGELSCDLFEWKGTPNSKLNVNSNCSIDTVEHHIVFSSATLHKRAPNKIAYGAHIESHMGPHMGSHMGLI